MKILVLGGGGTTGVIPIVFLNNLRNQNFLNNIDVISGSSVGGVNALSLAYGYSSSEIFSSFKQEIPKIFHRSIWRTLNIFATKYSDKYIEEFLHKHFRDKTMEYLSKKVVVPTMSWKYDRPKVFTNLQGSEDMSVYLWKIARATTAAPTYFPPYGQNVYLDGGIVENIPVITTITAIRSKLGIPFDKMDVFAIGSGVKVKMEDRDRDDVKEYTKISWFTRFVIPYITRSNEVATEYWSKNIGLHSLTIFNPVGLDCHLDDIKPLVSGELEGLCHPFQSLFSNEFEYFLSR